IKVNALFTSGIFVQVPFRMSKKRMPSFIKRKKPRSRRRTKIPEAQKLEQILDPNTCKRDHIKKMKGLKKYMKT
ncbi:hypothetical protein Q6247_26275, partial [Klebsiella pneumoniae]